MRIILSPQRRDDALEVIKAGNVLTVNGQVFDFSPMSNGDTLPNSAINCEWFAGDVDMESGELTLTLLLPNPWNFSQEQAFPVPLEHVPDGPVVFPPPLPEPLPAAPEEEPEISHVLKVIDHSNGTEYEIAAMKVIKGEFEA